MNIYRDREFHIDKKHKLYGYCDKVTSLCCNLENAVRFRQRQLITAVKKDPEKYSENESLIIQEIMDAIPKMSKSYPIPSKERFVYDYYFYDNLMKITNNPDYLADGLPRQTAQQSIKKNVRDIKSYFAAMKAYEKDASKFTGKPKFPGYHRKGGHSTAILTNQDAILKPYTSDNYSLKLPLTKEKLKIGHLPENTRLKEVKIVPDNGIYIIHVILQYEIPDVTYSETPERIAAIDMGVDNLMAVTNNCGLENLLYKGGVAKSVNRLYNKKIADIVSRQTLATKKKFTPTDDYYAVTRKRNNTLKDLFHKTAKHFISWCVENRIDTIVIGKNPLWKQECDIHSDAAKQTFVQLPFDMLRNFLKYLAESVGIRYVEREESYTSKASFLDDDYIPTYGVDDEKASFSGIRGPKRYKGMYKSSGFRGIYKTASGIYVNSDLNGSANILRKEYPDAFKDPLDLNHVTIISHPDHDKAVSLKGRQLHNHAHKSMSRSKLKRKHRKKSIATVF